MHNILKSFVLNPTQEKWRAWNEYQEYFKEREPQFDVIHDFIQESYKEFGSFPTESSISLSLGASNEIEVQKYFNRVMQDPGLNVFQTDVDFCNYLPILKQVIFESDFHSKLRESQNSLAGLQGKDVNAISGAIQELIGNLHQIQNLAVRDLKSNCGLIYGHQAQQEFIQIYEKIKKERASGNTLYFDFGVDKFDDVKMKRGDLVIIGGHTSQGKSVWARYLAYRMLVEYGLNVYYLTLEMGYENQLGMFQVLHANNKKIFPGTPNISYTKFKNATLTPEEELFLTQVANVDFSSSQSYGSLYLEQPNKSKFRLSDVQEKLRELENNVMPIDVLVIDYATMLYPIESDKKQPDREDYNLMIKGLKSLALTHKNSSGKVSPLICFTPAQISRDHFEEAMRNKGKYDITCLRQYSELEMSADIVVTTLLTEEGRQNGVVKLQNLKNRDGAVVIDPLDCNIDFDHGFRISVTRKQTAQETIAALHAAINL